MLVASILFACASRQPAPPASGVARDERVGPPRSLPATAPARIALLLDTTDGPVRCELDRERAPRAVAMIVGLAAGTAPFRDPRTHEIVRRPYYDGILFFRAIPDVLVQTGCLVGDGSGTPGYRLPVETSAADAARLAHPGALFLARYTPPPGRADPAPPPPGDVIGSQLVIALTDMSHLAGQVTVVGACRDLDSVARIAHAVATGGSEMRLIHASVRPDAR